MILVKLKFGWMNDFLNKESFSYIKLLKDLAVLGSFISN